MNEQFHGIDLHKRYATINVRDKVGSEIKYIARCTDFQEYINTLGGKDSVVLESINNAFYWADQIEKQRASCIIVNPYKFKIIKESWNKTDERDAANLSLALWMSEIRHEFKLPTVYKPSAEIRELRKLFSQYQMISGQLTQHKNSIQAVFVENGIALDRKQTYQLFKPDGDVTILEEFNITGASKLCVLPTIIRQKGYRFFFYSREGNEPVHIHISKDDMMAKYWIKPVKLSYNSGFKKKDLKIIKEIVFSNQKEIEEAWYEFFKSD